MRAAQVALVLVPRHLVRVLVQARAQVQAQGRVQEVLLVQEQAQELVLRVQLEQARRELALERRELALERRQLELVLRQLELARPRQQQVSRAPSLA